MLFKKTLRPCIFWLFGQKGGHAALEDGEQYQWRTIGVENGASGELWKWRMVQVGNYRSEELYERERGAIGTPRVQSALGVLGRVGDIRV